MLNANSTARNNQLHRFRIHRPRTSIWGSVSLDIFTQTLGEDIPDGESTHLSEGLKQRVSFTDVTYDVEVSIPDVQVHAVANSSLFADDLREFVTPQNHDESSMV